MTLQSSGAISIDDIVAEFTGSDPDVLAEYYRGAGLTTENNTSVPTSGPLAINDFYGAVRIITKVVSSSTINLVLDSLFDSSELASGAPLQVIINSGVTIGSNDIAIPACRTGTGGVGTLELINNGYIYAAGGAAEEAGGTAFKAERSITVDNQGRLYGGGGGGGNGGIGGDRFTIAYPNGLGWEYNYPTNKWWEAENCQLYPTEVYYTGTYVDGEDASGPKQHDKYPIDDPPVLVDVTLLNEVGTSNWFERGEYVTFGDNCSGKGSVFPDLYRVRKFVTTPITTGDGGVGGVGQGYNHSLSSGSPGSISPPFHSDVIIDLHAKATTDGDGGGGGNWGAVGTSGTNGENGIITNGQTGHFGGGAGKYTEGNSNITWTNLGTVLGGVS